MSKRDLTAHCAAHGKRKYESFAAALARLEAIQEGIGELEKLTGTVYSCDACSGWHVSSRRLIPVKPKGRGKKRRGAA
jgi:hypothetical protein